MSRQTTPKKKVVLLGVVVQPVIVAVSEGGSKVEPLPTQEPTQISAADWSGYPAQLEQALKDAEKNLNQADQANERSPSG